MQGMMILLALSPFVSGDWHLLTDPTVPSDNISVGQVTFEYGLVAADNPTTVPEGSLFRTTATPSRSFLIVRVWGSAIQLPPTWTSEYATLQHVNQVVTSSQQSILHTSSEVVEVAWSFRHTFGVESWQYFDESGEPGQTITRNVDKRDSFIAALFKKTPHTGR
jgi:hypothetical protein